jgi:hypothetical protein
MAFIHVRTGDIRYTDPETAFGGRAADPDLKTELW